MNTEKRDNLLDNVERIEEDDQQQHHRPIYVFLLV